MSEKQLKCPVLGCGRDPKFIRFECEEIPMPATMLPQDLERKPPLGEIGRNFLVECPEHGEKCVQQIGHHVTNIPKKAKTKK